MVKIRLKNFEKLLNDLIIQKPMYGRGLTNVKYGTKNEKIALQKYIHLYKHDVIVLSNKKAFKVLEIKCPITCQNKPIIDKTGNLNLSYLIRGTNNIIELK